MSLTKYRAFLKVAATGSFSDAAEQIFCTQSAASRMIHDLEDIWGVRLFDRFKSGAKLTPEGQALLPAIEKVVFADEDLKNSVSSLKHLVTGTVRIATFASVSTVWLPLVIKAFKKLYPGINYEVLMGDYIDIERWVRSGRVDFGFTTPVIGEGLESVLVTRDELLLAVHSDHPFAKLARVPAKKLNDEPFFLLEKGRPGAVSAYLNENDIHPAIELTTFEDYAIMNMVRMGLGCGILPELILQYPVEDVHLKHLKPTGYREILLITRQGAVLSLAASEFLRCFASELKEELDPRFEEKINKLMAPKTHR